MIPILFDKNETAFASNGIGRLRDCISCICTEERNGIYECDFEYPMDGANFDLIQVGRIIGVTHDESSDLQPFDIVSYSRPINGIVTFHCVHISYRQSYMSVTTGTAIESLAAAFALFPYAAPSNPFSYWTDKTSTGHLGCADGTPRTVREMLGGIEGSVLDAYKGEYEWDKWTVKLWEARGQARDLTIRYGVNMLDYNEEYNIQGAYSKCLPYWTDGENKIVGNVQTAEVPTITGRGECIPLDVSAAFEEQPTQAQVEAEGLKYLNDNKTSTPAQNIKVSFVRLQDMGEYADFQALMQCRLCDTIKVVFPFYKATGEFKIVKTVWNVLQDKYEEMELGSLSVSLAEALGVGNTLERSGGGGGTVTVNYNDLDNKPQINGVTLTGNKTSSNLSIHEVPSGGSSGQVLSKASGTDYDLSWITPSGGGGEELEDISSQFTFGGAWTSIVKKAWKYGKLVFFHLEASVGSYQANYGYTIATIASGYRPSAMAVCHAYTTDGNYNPKAVVSAQAQTNGNIVVRSQNTTGAYFFVSGFYVLP